MNSDRHNRLALVGASTLVGREIKERLAEAGVPGSVVELLELEEEVGLVTDYGEEARVVVEAAEASLEGFRLVCFCGDPGIAQRFAPAVLDSGATIIDCTGGLRAEASVWGASSKEARSVVVPPHGGTALLAALAQAVDLDGAVATLLLPASELDQGGPEELARQSVSLLSFEKDDEGGAFGRRQAFDLWVDEEAAGRALQVVRAELGELGLAVPRLAAVRTPVFHALAATVYLPGSSVDEVLAALGEASIPVDGERGGERIDSPARAAGRDGVHVSHVRADPNGGTWLWTLMDNYLVTAAAVLEIVATHLDYRSEAIN